MKELFVVKGIKFTKEEFLDDIRDFEDIIPILQELSSVLSYEVIEVVGENDCCNKTNKNYFIEIQGFINNDDEFITLNEITENDKKDTLDLFVIRVYKCVDCGKWIIDILE